MHGDGRCEQIHSDQSSNRLRDHPRSVRRPQHGQENSTSLRLEALHEPQNTFRV